jgi:hypothetical protein
MAAGLGFKTFNTGDVLTASDTNGYLMQGIWVFANAAARDAAVTSPQEGNSCYLKDTDVIQVYSGSAWVTKSGASPLTTKGDLYTYSTTDARLASSGVNNDVLMVDTSTATGLKWAAPASGGMTLINTGGTTFGNGTITISSIPTTYVNLFVVIEDWLPFDNAAWIQMRFNGDSTANRHFIATAATTAGTYNTTNVRLSAAQSNAAGQSLTTALIPNYANANTWKYVVSHGLMNNNTTSTDLNFAEYYGFYNQTTAITSLSFSTGVSNTFGSGAGLSGTIYVYGVK